MASREGVEDDLENVGCIDTVSASLSSIPVYCERTMTDMSLGAGIMLTFSAEGILPSR